MTGEPPVMAGAVHLAVAVALPPVATPIVGASGIVAGVTVLDRIEKPLDPSLLVASTWNR